MGEASACCSTLDEEYWVYIQTEPLYMICYGVMK